MNEDRRNCGEQRIIAIGEVDGLVLVAAYTNRNGTRRIFSARLANRKERETWRTGRKRPTEIRAMKPRLDLAKIDAITDEDIARQIAHDANLARELTLDDLTAPKNLRRWLGMTQETFAGALGIPVATLRNWKQGRAACHRSSGTPILILVARDREERSLCLRNIVGSAQSHRNAGRC